METTPVCCAVLEDFLAARTGIDCAESRLVVAVIVRALADTQSSDKATCCDANRWVGSRIVRKLCDLIELDSSYVGIAARCLYVQGIAARCLYVQGVRPEEVVC